MTTPLQIVVRQYLIGEEEMNRLLAAFLVSLVCMMVVACSQTTSQSHQEAHTIDIVSLPFTMTSFIGIQFEDLIGYRDSMVYRTTVRDEALYSEFRKALSNLKGPRGEIGLDARIVCIVHHSREKSDTVVMGKFTMLVNRSGFALDTALLSKVSPWLSSIQQESIEQYFRNLPRQ